MNTPRKLTVTVEKKILNAIQKGAFKKDALIRYFFSFPSSVDRQSLSGCPRTASFSLIKGLTFGESLSPCVGEMSLYIADATRLIR